jgi:hypothetical protein
VKVRARVERVEKLGVRKIAMPSLFVVADTVAL